MVEPTKERVPEAYIKIIQDMYGLSNPGNDKGRKYRVF